MELDPFARTYALGRTLIRARQFDAALNEARIRSQAQPNNAELHSLLCAAYKYKGMEKESAEELERTLELVGDSESANAVRQAFRRGGYRAVLEWDLNEYKKKATVGYVSPIDFADDYAQLGLKEETIRYLEQAYEEHAPYLVHVQNDPNFDFVHSEPRYRAIVKKMGLPPAY